VVHGPTCGATDVVRPATVPRLSALSMTDPERFRPAGPANAPSPDCERTRACLSAFVDGEADPTEAAGVRAHLATCDRCRYAAQGLRQLIAAVRGVEVLPVAAPRRLRVRIEQQFADARRRN
jgi:hypothetical protein